MASYGAIEDVRGDKKEDSSSQKGHAQRIFMAVTVLSVCALLTVFIVSSRSSQSMLTLEQLASISVPDGSVQYIRVPASAIQSIAQYQAAPAQYLNMVPAAAQSLASVNKPVSHPSVKAATSSHPVIEYVPLKEIEALAAHNKALAARKTGFIRRQQLAVGGGGVFHGQQLDDEAAPAAAPAAPIMPAPVTPPTPQEIAMALQRIQEREIQQQTFKDTLIDAQTGQPLHVPGVPGSSHNGVSGIGGVFGVGGFLGPSYPVSDQVSPMASFSTGPACTCTSCTGSPPVCTGCTCR